jgi:putative isomerase
MSSSRNDFPNVIDVQKGNPYQPEGYFFIDKGAWHGFGLGAVEESEYYGGFRGPFLLLGRGRTDTWGSECLARFILRNTLGDIIPYESRLSAILYPGILTQSYSAGPFLVKQSLIFLSGRTSMTQTTVANTTSRNATFIPGWEGSYLRESISCIRVDSHTIGSVFSRINRTYLLRLPDNMNWAVEINKNAYSAIAPDSIHLARGEEMSFCTFDTHLPDIADIHRAREENRQFTPEAADGYLKHNEERWNTYLSRILNRKTRYLANTVFQTLAAKCLITLLTNWRSPAGDIHFAGVSPSASGFFGFWAWDSWEHALALAYFFPELAKDQIRAMFDYQSEDGMIPDCIYLDKHNNNMDNSKPPLASWSVRHIFRLTGDMAFVEEMVPKLMAYHRWWYRYRDHNRNGLCEYGGTKNSSHLGQWESGMDVAVKFDNATMERNGPNAWSFNQESIELNSYLYAEKRYLAELLEAVGDDDTASALRKEAERLRSDIQQKMFDEETGYFYDIRMNSEVKIKVIDPSGWIPLLTGVATGEQASAVRKVMLSESKFGHYYPFCSLAHDDPHFSPDKHYFRGNLWLNYVYFGIRGLKNYGYFEDSEEYILLLPERLEGLAEPGVPIHENYNSKNGKRLHAGHFSWSCAFCLLLIVEDSDTFPFLA